MMKKIRRKIMERKGTEVLLVCDEGRNIIRKQKAIIREIYASVFIVDVYKDNNTIQRESYSYNDLLTKVIQLCTLKGEALNIAT